MGMLPTRQEGSLGATCAALAQVVPSAQGVAAFPGKAGKGRRCGNSPGPRRPRFPSGPVALNWVALGESLKLSELAPHL